MLLICFMSAQYTFAQGLGPVSPNMSQEMRPGIHVYNNAGADFVFENSGLQNLDLVLPTALDFGPDGRLYVGQKNGLIIANTIVRNGSQDYEVLEIEKIFEVKNSTANHDDDGAVNAGTVTQNGWPLNLASERQLTGLLVVGTAENPIVYATSSDPRIGGGGVFNDTGLDTNSGIVHRITKETGSWVKVDIVRGLPRSEENHATNGLQLDESTNTLYVTSGGMTNAGAPSNNFALITEYALSAAILAVDLNVIDAMPVLSDGGQKYIYDIPTLDDPTRSNLNGIDDPNTPGYDGIDTNDPFGGNNGLNQAKLVTGGPVQLEATGLRNPYDVVFTESGRLYSVDNGANSGWGGFPVGEDEYPGGASPGTCTNDYDPSEPGSTSGSGNDDIVNNMNGLHFIREVEAGFPYYAGHPAPIRGNPAGAGLFTSFDGNNVFRTSTTGDNPLPPDWPPVPVGEAYAAECDFRNSGIHDGAIANYGPISVNGIAEYNASFFNNEMRGSLVMANMSGDIHIAILNEAGDQVINGDANGNEVLFPTIGGVPLDIVTQDDDGSFPGTIWTVGYLGQVVTVFEPLDAGCAGGPGSQDDDGDGYSNDDEIDNNTDECFAEDKPDDIDGDLVSDLNDPDDDNDGIVDVDDPFAIDDTNGIGNGLPIMYDLFNDDPATGFFGLGFTGLMYNGSATWLDQLDRDTGVFGGEAGLLTFPTVTEGTALDSQNDQENAMQFGVDVSSASPPFEIEVVIKSPFFSMATPQDGQSHGFYIGSGDQDNYLKVALAANGGNGGIEVVEENAGSATTTVYGNNLSGDVQIPDDVLGASESLSLFLKVVPAAGTALPGYQVDSGEPYYMGSPISLSGDLLSILQSNSEALAVGVIASSDGPGGEFSATWDKIEITPISTGASADIKISPPEDINESTTTDGSFNIENTSINGQRITSVSFNLSTSILPDVVFDPDGTAGDDAGKGFAANQGAVETGFTDAEMESPHNGVDGDDGYDAVTATFTDFNPGDVFAFSIDVDPTTIKGTSAQGPGESGSVSGLELSGASITVNFDDGSSYTTELYRIPGSVSGSQGTAAPGLLDAPGISLPGSSTLKTRVDELDQTIQVSGPVGQDVKLLVVEAALFLPDGGGYDVDAFEGNSVIGIQEFEDTIGDGGFVDFPVTLANSQEEGGINFAMAVFVDAEGLTGEVSDVVVLDYDPDAVATTIMRINAGGPAVSINGVSWDADEFYSGGGTFSNSGIEILGTDNDFVYQTERFDTGMNGFEYNIPVPGDGMYNVSLHFAEIFFGAPGDGETLGGPGQRVFNIDIEGGQGTITDLDIYDEAGAATALVRTFEDVSVTDGSLQISLSSSVREGKISGIEVSTLGEPSPITVTPNPIDFYVAEVGGSSNARAVTLENSGDDAITVTGVSYDGADSGEFSHTFTSEFNIDAGMSGEIDIAFAPTSEGAKSAQLAVEYTGGSGSPAKITVDGEGQTVEASDVLYRVNAGGQSLLATDGKRVWGEDQSSVTANALGQANVGAPSPYVNATDAGDHTFGTLDTVTLDPSVPSSVPPDVFKTEHWDPAAEPNQQWSFEVPSDTYVEIRVYLAEIFLTEETNPTDGPRIFDIAVDGTVPAVFDNLDTFAEVGHDVGIMKTFNTTSDGSIDLELIKDGGDNFPAIKGIEILEQTDTSNEVEAGVPESFRLIGNYPNPFNPSTNVIFELPEPAIVHVEVYDVMGRKVLELPGTSFAPGTSQVTIDASELSSGIYLYRVIAQMNEQSLIRSGRMTFLK